MGRSFRRFKINGHTVQTGRPKLYSPYEGAERIEGPPYHFNIFTDKENLEYMIQGDKLVIFEEWGTPCCDVWTWYQHPIQIFKQVVFQKYEHLIDDYVDSYVKAFFTADEIWWINGTLMEEIPKDKFNNDWNLAPRSPTRGVNVKKMAWQEEKVWTLIDGQYEAAKITEELEEMIRRKNAL